jgi:hypothetical protein
MQYQTKIEGQDVNIWTDGGTVEALTLRSQTNVWTEGGAGYIGPTGGFISPPNVRSSTTEIKEVRFLADDGSRRTVTVGGGAAVVPGDRVAFVFASGASHESGKLVGFVNHTEGRWWSFARQRLIPEASRLKRAGVALLILAVFFVGLIHHGRLPDYAFAASTVSQKISDWESYHSYQREHQREKIKISVDDYAKRFRPQMDLSTDEFSLYEQLSRLTGLANASNSEGWGLFYFAIIFPIGLILFQKFSSARFNELVNKALRREVAALCEAGDNALDVHIGQNPTAPTIPRVAA